MFIKSSTKEKKEEVELWDKNIVFKSQIPN